MDVAACLNSRPLYSLSNNAQNLTPVTPGHCLVGENLVVIPKPGKSEGSSFKGEVKHLELMNRFQNDF